MGIGVKTYTKRTPYLCLLLAAVALSGCGSDSDNNFSLDERGANSAPPTSPPQTPDPQPPEEPFAAIAGYYVDSAYDDAALRILPSGIFDYVKHSFAYPYAMKKIHCTGQLMEEPEFTTQPDRITWFPEDVFCRLHDTDLPPFYGSASEDMRLARSPGGPLQLRATFRYCEETAAGTLCGDNDLGSYLRRVTGDDCPADNSFAEYYLDEDYPFSWQWDPCRNSSTAIDLSGLEGIWPEFFAAPFNHGNPFLNLTADPITPNPTSWKLEFGAQATPDSPVTISGSYKDVCAVEGTATPLNSFWGDALVEVRVTGCTEATEITGTLALVKNPVSSENYLYLFDRFSSFGGPLVSIR